MKLNLIFHIAAITFTSAKKIDVSCLTLSEQIVGQEKGQYKSNMAQLINSNVSDDMRLHAITTCTNNWNDVVGI